MLGTSTPDHHKNYYNSQPKGFLTPPPAWRTSWCSPPIPISEKKPRRSPQGKGDLFHVVHKVPSGDSPYVRAKHVQLIDKDPSKAISLFWAAINSGDRVDSALKDMAIVMKQLDRSDEAIEAIRSFRHLCPHESQESLDNILVELYKRSGRIEEEIEMLQLKLKQLEEGFAFGGKRTKIARSQGKKIQITIEKEYSRLLGNLAWSFMQKGDFKSAEENYRKGLSFEPDKNKQCNLAVCLMHMNKLTEARFLLQTVRVSSENDHVDESYTRYFERATQMLAELESGHTLKCAEQSINSDGFGANGTSESPYDYKASKMAQDSPFGPGRIPKVPLTQPRSTWSLNSGDQRRRWLADDPQGNARFSCKVAHNSSFGVGKSPLVPFTQPRQGLRSFNSGDQRNGRLVEDAEVGFCRKLSFDQKSTNEENKQQLLPNQNLESNFSGARRPLGNQSRADSKEASKIVDLLAYDGPNQPPKEKSNLASELNFSCDGTDSEPTAEAGCGLSSNFSIACSLAPKADKVDSENIQPSEKQQKDWKITDEFSTCETKKKSWADMVEEDEEELQIWGSSFTRKDWDFTDSEAFSDENMDTNIMPESPTFLNEAEDLCQKIDLKSGYDTQPENAASLTNQSVKRCFSFYPHQKQARAEKLGHGSIPSENCSPTKSVNLVRRNRLPVFKDLTRAPGSPRP